MVSFSKLAEEQAVVKKIEYKLTHNTSLDQYLQKLLRF